MIAAENLDHQPQTVTLERLPDGTALLWLRKDIRQTTPQMKLHPAGVQSGDGASDGNPSGTRNGEKRADKL